MIQVHDQFSVLSEPFPTYQYSTEFLKLSWYGWKYFEVISQLQTSDLQIDREIQKSFQQYKIYECHWWKLLVLFCVSYFYRRFFLVITVNTIPGQPLWPRNPLQNKLLPSNVYSLKSGQSVSLRGVFNIILKKLHQHHRSTGQHSPQPVMLYCYIVIIQIGDDHFIQ